VESSISHSSSISSCNFSKAEDQMPALHQRLNRVYTLIHGPNFSGKSRHGHPVLAFQSIASTIIRLSFDGLASLPLSAGRSCASLDHIRLVNISLIQLFKQIQRIEATLKTRPSLGYGLVSSEKKCCYLFLAQL